MRPRRRQKCPINRREFLEAENVTTWKLNVPLFFSRSRSSRREPMEMMRVQSGAEFETSPKERVCLHATRPPIALDNVHIAVHVDAGHPRVVQRRRSFIPVRSRRCARRRICHIKGHRPLQERTIDAPTRTRGLWLPREPPRGLLIDRLLPNPRAHVTLRFAVSYFEPPREFRNSSRNTLELGKQRRKTARLMKPS